MENFEGFNDVVLGWLKKVNIDLDLGYDEDEDFNDYLNYGFDERCEEEFWEGIIEIDVDNYKDFKKEVKKIIKEVGM
jgi:hypothetical protein